nr:molybdopterin cofactor-binding domain-containing protein [Rubellimicrobium mesophilum]
MVATRDQGFTIATYRPEMRHHIQLGASRDGKLTALRHEGWELTGRPSQYNVSGTETTTRVHAVPNIQTRVNLANADRNTPGFMRAPPGTPYLFALESAMGELAVKLGIDPIELRRINDTQTDPVDGTPSPAAIWSSASTRAPHASAGRGGQHSPGRCGTAIGWSARAARPQPIRPTSPRPPRGSRSARTGMRPCRSPDTTS